MLTYRTFRNTDPPALVSIWRSRTGQRGLLQPVSADLFEQLIFAKPYFDYQGLILAWDNGRPVGFAHAAFGPGEQEHRIATEMGVTCLVMVRPDCVEAEVAEGLLERCEDYLLQHGAKVLYGGEVRPLNPFYLGLYGGSELPGVLQSDSVALNLFLSHAYKQIDQTLILQCDLNNFQAPAGRQLLQLRRQMTVEMIADCPAQSWWQACTVGDFELTRFELIPRGGGPVLAQATFRSMEPSIAGGLVRTAGLIDLEVSRVHLRQGLASFLLSEAFHNFIRQGIMLVEAQTMQHNTAALGLYRKFGFAEVDQGRVFRKEAHRGR